VSWPARQRSSSQLGLIGFDARREDFGFHAAAAASKPSSCAAMTSTASGPSMRESVATRCQENKKRMKSRAATGSISVEAALAALARFRAQEAQAR